MNVHPRKRYNNNNNYRRQGRNNSNRNNNNSGGNNFGPPRPRKNFRALQEKYLNMAKEAMSSGDRILAEYYLQYADHYHRQNEEFLEERNKWHDQRAQRRSENEPNAEDTEDDLSEDANDDNADGDTEEDVDLSSSGSALPAFLTRKVAAKEGAEKVVQIQDWEE